MFKKLVCQWFKEPNNDTPYSPHTKAARFSNSRMSQAHRCADSSRQRCAADVTGCALCDSYIHAARPLSQQPRAIKLDLEVVITLNVADLLQ